MGYVQSGKTLSFTAAIAMARDNGFQLIIVLAGSSTQLAKQSQDRIREDLRIGLGRRRSWAPYHNPKPADAPGIVGLFDKWRDPFVPARQRQTIIITVMKQHTHLRNLTRLVQRLDLAGVTALVIDDEADQVSLNTRAKQFQQARKSTTYARLMELRGALPSHTYLQYTATPQAPLLISIIDSLSARWVDVLQPGMGYTGGITFFGPGQRRAAGAPLPARPLQHERILRVIPVSEIPAAAGPIDAIPPTLEAALRLFMVGVAAAYVHGDTDGDNRSMLVHPSRETADHLTYRNWINDLFQEWRSVFSKSDSDPRGAADLAETFRDAYDDLADTVGPGMPPFDDVKLRFRVAFNDTEIKEVNRRTGQAVIIDWSQRYPWILIGGQAMDRGFTVEGLTVTYMPRGLGGGNADSLQQRARFFGYKQRYLGYCRVFLEQGVSFAFGDYVEHEEFMRDELIRIRDEQEPLQDWPRKFVLDPTLKPCRDNVLQDPYTRSLADPTGWVATQAFLGGGGFEAHNREVVEAFVGSHEFYDDDGDPRRTTIQKHRVTEPLPLREVMNELTSTFRLRDPSELDKWTGLHAQLAHMLEEDSDTMAIVVLMSPGERRERGINPASRVKQFFQGEAPVKPLSARGSIYPGDREIADDRYVTIQVYRLNLTRGIKEDKRVVAEDIPFLAIRLPSSGAVRSLVLQAQAAQAAPTGASS
ncbi:Z1 domain-containing protein [Methylobacterium sp. W2]|uniref:Z1 domain-containing protein n=1 Tax=Methylobacterium sp. W2 TaxID=2598107 RepID=UPI001D0CA2C1|nr:Z1 domain-containing protein [Methylobacterium sp. W2]